MDLQNKDDIHNMTVKKQDTKSLQTTVSQKLHPGFLCFFKDNFSKVSTTFEECYSSLEKANLIYSHFKFPLSRIVDSSLHPEQKIEQIKTFTNKSKRFLYYYCDSEEEIKSQIIDQGYLDSIQIQNLSKQLIRQEQQKSNVMRKKAQQFRIVRQENQRKLKEENQRKLKEENQRKLKEEKQRKLKEEKQREKIGNQTAVTKVLKESAKGKHIESV